MNFPEGGAAPCLRGWLPLGYAEEILTGEGAEGTDGLDAPAGSSEEMSFVVPGKTLTEVRKLLPEDDGTVGIQVGRRHILFTIGSYTVISRLLEGEFLDYRSAIPSACQTEVKVNTREFTTVWSASPF